MKKVTYLLLLILITNLGFGQVFSGGQEIDKGNREGAYIMVNSDVKFTEKAWQSYMANFGKQISTKY